MIYLNKFYKFTFNYFLCVLCGKFFLSPLRTQRGTEVFSLCSSVFSVVKYDFITKQTGFYETVRNEMRLRNYSHKTIKSYLSCLRLFNKYIAPKRPREVSENEIRNLLLFLIEERKFSASSVNQVFNALRFLYVELYRTPFVINKLPKPKKDKKLPDILSQDELISIFNAVDNLKHKTLLMLIYSAGLRVGEAVRIKIQDIDSNRKLIHIRQAKGKKDRFTLLSDSVLEMLRKYYK